MIAKKMGIALTDGPGNKEYLMKLAAAAEENGFGQCNEMAALAASKLALISQNYKLNIYTFQMPDSNQAMVLLSRNTYRSSNLINWGIEFNSKSIVADLWQGILAPKQPEFLTSYAKINLYTKSKPRAYIQTQFW
ncbi:hypothetical protein [Fluviispira vulneris]|uniref:hypothetical protein n=1 Tax=Fluviispira vulneris TaxID=2763012 RepID=UPI001646FAAA|nr:hypothetical protein [Fluviispira vulneris]